jgi:hypothetical protein
MKRVYLKVSVSAGMPELYEHSNYQLVQDEKNGGDFSSPFFQITKLVSN